MFVHFRCFSR